MKNKQIISAALVLALAIGTVPAYAKELTNAGEMASADVTLDVTGSPPEIFSVTVPTEIPIHMDSDGNITVANDLSIDNKSSEAVKVTAISVEGKNGWGIVDFDSNVAEQPLGTKELALSFRGDKTQDGGNVALTPENWTIEEGASLSVNAEARLPRQIQSSKTSIAAVVWTLDWAGTHNAPPIDNGHEITVLPGENGSAESSSPIITDNVGKIPQFPMLTPDDGYVFDHWEDSDGNLVDENTVFDGPTSIKPVFKPDNSINPPQDGYIITILPGDHGNTGGVNSIKTNFLGEIDSLPNVYPDNGYNFIGWQDEDGNPVDVNTVFDKPASIIPVFEKQPNPIVSILPSEHGNTGDVSRVQTDDNHKIPNYPEVYPDAGYLFDHWEDDNGNPVDETTVFTDADFIVPVFRVDDTVVDNTRTITILPGRHGSAAETSVKTDRNGTITYLPDVETDDGYVFVVYVDSNDKDVKVGDVITQDMEIRPAFKKIVYQDFTITSANRTMVGYTGTANENLIIPEKFAGDDGNYYRVVSIAADAFNNCSNLVSVKIPESVTEIGARAFFGDRNLTTANIPQKVTVIHEGTFRNTGLNSIVIPDNVTSIESSAFAQSGISSVNIPYGVKNIGESAFQECGNLTSVTIPNSVTTMGEYAFSYCGSLSSVTLPSSLSAINNSCFYKCSALTYISIPGNIKTIGDGAFYECTSLRSVDMSYGVTTLEHNAFAYCTNLSSVSIPSSVKNVRAQAFMNCSSLTSLSLPNGVTTIGNCAFADCVNLTLTVPRTVTTIEASAFSRVKRVNYSGSASGRPWGCSDIQPN